MTISAEELRERTFIILGPKGSLKPETRERIEQLKDIEDLDAYVRKTDWSCEAEREFMLGIVAEAAEMQAACSDEGGLRRVFVSLLANARPEYGMFFAGAVTLVRRYLYSCIYKAHGLSVARAYERVSLSDILAFWPSFTDDYPFLISVSKAGPGTWEDSHLLRAYNRRK